MSLLELCVDVLRAGTVAGLALGTPPDAWRDALGARFVDDRRKRQLRRDFGLVELTFALGDDGWRCFSIALQLHRLAFIRPVDVPSPLRASLQSDGERVTEDDLLALLSSAGVVVVAEGSAQWRVAAVHGLVTVDDAALPPRPVWAIHLRAPRVGVSGAGGSRSR